MEALRIKSTERVRYRALKSSHKIRVFQKSKSQVRVRLQVFEKRFFFQKPDKRVEVNFNSGFKNRDFRISKSK